MKTVWKYTLAPTNHIKIPEGANILSVHEQNGEVCMWAMVDDMAPMEYRDFEVFGTGHSIPDKPMQFIGTVHLLGGELVFHVFETL